MHENTPYNKFKSSLFYHLNLWEYLRKCGSKDKSIFCQDVWTCYNLKVSKDELTWFGVCESGRSWAGIMSEPPTAEYHVLLTFQQQRINVSHTKILPENHSLRSSHTRRCLCEGFAVCLHIDNACEWPPTWCQCYSTLTGSRNGRALDPPKNHDGKCINNAHLLCPNPFFSGETFINNGVLG